MSDRLVEVCDFACVCCVCVCVCVMCAFSVIIAFLFQFTQLYKWEPGVNWGNSPPTITLGHGIAPSRWFASTVSQSLITCPGTPVSPLGWHDHLVAARDLALLFCFCVCMCLYVYVCGCMRACVRACMHPHPQGTSQVPWVGVTAWDFVLFLFGVSCV